LSTNKVTHGFHLVEGKSGHDMEDYHVAEYKYVKNHELGLFAIFDGHLGDKVPSYLKANLFSNIMKEVSVTIVFVFCVGDQGILFSFTIRIPSLSFPYSGYCSLSSGLALKKQ
jgi:serine/threonine protein phosphatase PrpC